MADIAPHELVQDFLRGQNLEQVREVDEAIALYERAVEGGFDSAGPYDRLIAIYRGRSAHTDVIRVAETALDNVRTFNDKRTWYRGVISDAQRLLAEQPDPTGPEF